MGGGTLLLLVKGGCLTATPKNPNTNPNIKPIFFIPYTNPYPPAFVEAVFILIIMMKRGKKER